MIIDRRGVVTVKGERSYYNPSNPETEDGFERIPCDVEVDFVLEHSEGKKDDCWVWQARRADALGWFTATETNTAHEAIALATGFPPSLDERWLVDAAEQAEEQAIGVDRQTAEEGT